MYVIEFLKLQCRYWSNQYWFAFYKQLVQHLLGLSLQIQPANHFPETVLSGILMECAALLLKKEPDDFCLPIAILCCRPIQHSYQPLQCWMLVWRFLDQSKLVIFRLRVYLCFRFCPFWSPDPSRNVGFDDYIWLLFCFLFSGFIFSLACNRLSRYRFTFLQNRFWLLSNFVYCLIYFGFAFSMSTEFLKFILRSNLTGMPALSCLFYFLLAQQQTGDFFYYPLRLRFCCCYQFLRIWFFFCYCCLFQRKLFIKLHLFFGNIASFFSCKRDSRFADNCLPDWPSVPGLKSKKHRSHWSVK